MRTLAAQSEVMVAMMTKLEVMDVASKGASSVPRYQVVAQPVRTYSDVVGQPCRMPGKIQIERQTLSFFMSGGPTHEEKLSSMAKAGETKSVRPSITKT